MCTVTWVRGAAEYDLLTNRDERRVRGVAIPPESRTARGTRYLAPTDRDAGGTWIAVNEHGVSLTLLNHDPLPSTGPGAERGGELRSRGHLVRELAHVRSPGEVGALLRSEQALGRYLGFRLVAIGPAGTPREFTWDRVRLEETALGDEDLPLASSVYGDRERIRRARRAAWEELVLAAGGPTPERLARFHGSEHPAPGPEAVCMTRDDAATVSATWVSVRPDRIELRYCAGAPNRATFGAPLVLARAER